ncbi:Neurexophilin [Branchiostoma belcheri]|nr:Neurexophilin [Branchiostoma belcheri]
MSVSVVNPQTVYQVGETLSLKIVARDANGRPKSHGEDFLLAKLHTESPTEACTSAEMEEAIYIRAYQPPFNRDWGRFRFPMILDPVLTSHVAEIHMSTALGS